MTDDSEIVKMHAGEVLTSAEQVQRLLAAQFPQWADLPVERLVSSGTDNAMYRLGDDMVARFPRVDWAVSQVQLEQEWLPRLGPQLPLAIPAPLAMGRPGEGYPWNWSIYRWLPGQLVTANNIPDVTQAAVQLADFVGALQTVDPTGGPLPGGENSGRGLPLAERDEAVRQSIGELADSYDAEELTAAWEAALNAPVWDKPGVWIHGDLQDSNLLVDNGRLSAVIDWGCMGVGDPACDVIVAWKLFAGESRAAFRDALQVDEATWLRSKGWALSTGVMAVPYYHLTNPVLAESGRHAIREVLDDFRSSTATL